MGMPESCEEANCMKTAEFECEWCGKWFCRSHIHTVGRDSLQLCAPCKAAYKTEPDYER